MLSAIGLAFVLFAATNLDDIFVLVGFFADPKYQTRQIYVGQYLGMAALVAASMVLSLVSLVLSPPYVGLLGCLPVLIGLQKLWDVWRGAVDPEPEAAGRGLGRAFSVAAMTIVNGADNISTYAPVFAASTPYVVTIIVMVFVVMTALWIVFSRWLVQHPTLGAPLRRYGHIVSPLILIAIGVFVLVEADSFSLVTSSR